MEQRPFGTTGLTVSVLGLGAGQLGASAVSEEAAPALLHGALDAGVTLIDTARGYGLSEERIGRHLAHRRSEYVLSSKGGYDVEGIADWTAESVTLGIDQALRTLRTDVIDIFHLHSCSQEVLERGDLQDALDRAAVAGKIRVSAYSGDNEPLAYAADSGRFGSVETSVNLVDQWSLQHVLPRYPDLGVIAKRPLANAPWRYPHRPDGTYGDVYWDRLQALALDPAGLDWDEFALRFAAYAPDVDCVIAGTTKLGNVHRNAELVAKGPLSNDLLDAIHAAWERVGSQWPGDV